LASSNSRKLSRSRGEKPAAFFRFFPLSAPTIKFAPVEPTKAGGAICAGAEFRDCAALPLPGRIDLAGTALSLEMAFLLVERMDERANPDALATIAGRFPAALALPEAAPAPRDLAAEGFFKVVFATLNPRSFRARKRLRSPSAAERSKPTEKMFNCSRNLGEASNQEG